MPEHEIFSYKVQLSPDGLARAFILGEEFIGEDATCLILGDNIFHGSYFIPKLEAAIQNAEKNDKATVFYWVKDPERCGVAEFDNNGRCISFEEEIEKTVRWYLDNQDWMDNITSGEYERYYEDMYKN